MKPSSKQDVEDQTLIRESKTLKLKLQEARKSDPKARTVPIEKLRSKYYKKRGYDENGIPTRETLKRLGIQIPVTV